MRIYFSAGEPSGDEHAAHLMAEVQRRRGDVEFCGYGGPRMEAAGCVLDFQLTDLAVMGLWRVLPLLSQFYRLVKQAERTFRENPPDAVVLVDFPGFNWWIAKKAKAAGIPVFYYLPPQIWAWASWRVRRMRKYVDHVLCALPFEQDWYAERGVTAEFVGHPLFDEIAQRRLDEDFIAAQRSSGDFHLAVLPGSRNHEVTTNFPLMLQVLSRVHAQAPRAKFLAACYKQSQLDWCRQRLDEGYQDLPLELFVGKTSEIIELADAALMVSGSVSLELLARATPAVVMYRCSWLTRLMVLLLVRIDHMSLPNLMAGRRIMPEFLPWNNPPRDVAEMSAILKRWISDDKEQQRVARELAELRDRVAQHGATERAAAAIVDRLPAEDGVRRAA